MKWAPRMTVAVVVTLGFVALISVGSFAQTARLADVAFKAAQHIEEVEGNLRGAIDAYEKLAQGSDHAIAAQALVRMAGCYEKLGEADARDVYQRVLRDYADQAAPVAAARARLAALEVEPTPPSPTMTVREVLIPSEEQYNPLFVVSGDGQQIVYWHNGDLVIGSLATGETRRFYGVDLLGNENSATPILSPDDKKVAYVGCNSDACMFEIEVIALEGGHRETVYDSKSTRPMYTHDWSPDGERILLSTEAADGSVFLATVSLTDKTLQRLVTLDWAHPRRAQYSPDGRYIAYDSTKGGDRRIYLMSADSHEEYVLVDSPREDYQPLWSRDGRFLLFLSDRSGTRDLHALRMQNGQPTGDDVLIKSNLGTGTNLRGMTTEGQLYYHDLVGGQGIAISERINTPTQTARVRTLPKILAAVNRNPAFAPDGKRVAYLAGYYKDLVIRITDLEGKILKDIRLESRLELASGLHFSPDGKQLVLAVYDAGERKVAVLSAETGTLLKLLSPLEQEGYFRTLGWSRDGRLVYVFVRLDAGGRFLTAIDVETDDVVESTVLSRRVQSASLSPSREYLYMRLTDPAADNYLAAHLVLRSMEDGSEKLLTDQVSFFAIWDFDSRQLFYHKVEDEFEPRCCGDENRLYSFSLETEEETVLVDDMKDRLLVAVSPDGKYWALSERGDQDTHIWVLENFLPESTELSAGR